MHTACFGGRFSWEFNAGPASETPGCLDDNFSVMGPRMSLRDKMCLFFLKIFYFEIISGLHSYIPSI